MKSVIILSHTHKTRAMPPNEFLEAFQNKRTRTAYL